MITYADFIRKIKPIGFDKYSLVSSREKLVAFTISFLGENNIPRTFNNICIATFKFFPDKFYFSEEFNEFPHIEMLNRTILHLRPKERNYASGSVKQNYELTPLGKEVAKQVKIQINSGISEINPIKKIMDDYKKTSENDLNNILKSNVYNEWLKNNDVKEMELWDYFSVTPYTQIEKIKSDMKELEKYAKSKNEMSVVDFIYYIKNKIL